MGLLLQAVDVTGLIGGAGSWSMLARERRWADHPVNLDPHASETEAFEDLYRFLRWRADPDRRVASEEELVGRIGAWTELDPLARTPRVWGQ